MTRLRGGYGVAGGIRMPNLCESAELFLLFVLSASSVVKSRGCFAEGAAATDAK
jgi:hypothetical protein